MKVSCTFESLGRRSYREVWALQESLLEEVKQAKAAGKTGCNRLLFVEHNPVFTVGRSGKDSNMLASAALLQAKNAEFIHVDRGGDVTFHGPGQLVGYPIFNLEEFPLGVKAYVDKIEEVVIRSMAEYGIACERLPGATGVWIEPHTPRARKICAIGVKCSRYVTMHGFALNINTDLSYFRLINPCGFTDKGVTSMQQELGRALDFAQVCDCLRRNFACVFGLEYR
ncbi:MAG: lipoyl(octanoyl) transferase LipB [Bacteroidales bacterium]|nr:lipoyl(octanoyl) transferase LipB [Bacteroidales bacterium]MDE7072072.1 lipoyl(octanoyl) transferase LipB [Bacteroidales bacterium]